MFPDFVSISAGSIVLRDDRINSTWTVDIAPFFLARIPVTQALYGRVTGHSPSHIAGGDLPVDSVSWFDAIAFCNALSTTSGLRQVYRIRGDNVTLVQGADGYRLPTEAEWEYACRAGTKKVRYGELDAIAWYAGNSAGRSRPVGLKQPNPWGLHDMLGNVWEWCWDQYDPVTYGSYRVFRGGGWADAERGILASNRRRSHPTFAIDDLGFRIAR